ncbi:FtsK/SpoIIIE domain-containing protein [Streptomyces antimicrobicus]|uniref:FtsK domain-containing protein n=1 Tax=Streptomyces antimicrobicus TaxID=2883108 RepID=A0ABS8BB72_9ACTN|nr:FtsK/SpoIIIE domain-containing protein [Streptomyces antimicrobicus]MCB5181881.1 hypothetical protein [Streptomyces antimicrobicus]
MAGKKSATQDDIYGQSAGVIGTLAIVFGGLAALKDALGLSWAATVLLTVGVLVGLGYLAWRIRVAVERLRARGGQPAAVAAPQTPVQEPDAPEEDEDVEHVPVEWELTAALAAAGAIGKDQIIRADEATVTEIKTGVGVSHDFLVPKGRTYEDVEKRLSAVAGAFHLSRMHAKLEPSRDNERRVKLLLLREPPFTHEFPAPTRQEIQAFPGVPLGHEVTGELAGVPTFEKASLLVGGMTQVGKTTFVNALITCLLIAYGEFELYLLDGKFCGLTKFEKIATRYESSDDPAVFESMLDELNGRSDSRYGQIKNAIRERKAPPKFKPVFLIVDEAADFFAHDESREGKEQARRIAAKARSLVSKSLESQINTVLMSQRPAHNAIPVMVRDQFMYRLCLYVASSGTAKVVLGDTYFETVAPINPALLNPEIKGQGVLFATGRSRLIRGFNFSDEFIWGVVDEVHARRQSVLEKEIPDSPVKQAIVLMRSKGVEFMPSADLALALGITETRPVARGKALSALLGVAPGKDDGGVVRGYRLADLMAAANATR